MGAPVPGPAADWLPDDPQVRAAFCHDCRRKALCYPTSRYVPTKEDDGLGATPWLIRKVLLCLRCYRCSPPT